MSWHIIWTLLLLIIFIGIVLWAFSSRRKQDFEEAAQLPLEDDIVEVEKTPVSGPEGDHK